MEPMTKADAIDLMGGTVGAAAKQLKVSYQAVDKWPDVLPPRIEDRVLAALARQHLPASLLRPKKGGGCDVAHGGNVAAAAAEGTPSQTEAEKV